ncbi:MAG TPA: S8 family serine peptidase [Pyrinomonadaceae bacterium]|nr:S8 family serine peptidase [Pyrinomonadaceae bacterium]
MLKNLSNFRLAMTLLLIVAGLIFALHYANASSASSNAGTTSVIIELRDEPGAVYKAKIQRAGGSVSNEQLQAYRNQLRTGQDQLLNDLRSRGVQFQVDTVDINNFDGNLAGKVEYRYTLVLNAVTLTVPRAAIPVIESLPQVKKVHQNGYLHVALNKSVDYINAPKVYGRYQEVTPTDNFNEGYEGQGINIAVLDTGIDWKHEMFGGDPTPPRLGILPEAAAVNTNKKVIYYLPLAGTVDDFGHGSHASADAAGYMGTAPGADGIPGTSDDIRIHGVAPQARLMGYKVCAGVGSCLNAATILAIEDAVSPYTLKAVGSNTTGGDVPLIQKPVAHVINMSLGGAGGPDDPECIASDNAALMGTTVVAAAGNDGPTDSTLGAPAAGRRVIAVAADTDPGTGVNTADVIGGRTGMKAIAMEGSPAILTDIVQNFVYCGLAETPDAVPSNVTGKIAVIMRGSTVNTPELPAAGSLGTGLFTTKTTWATAKGAIAVVFINNVEGELSAATVRKSVVPVLGMSQDNGNYLLGLLGANPAVGASSTQLLRINKGQIFSPDMADFSSRGPVEGFGQIKPDVSAPGVDILSATVRVGAAETNTGTMFDPTGYIRASGTSFSTPHVAGVVALIKQAHPDWTPDMIRTALINTATSLRDLNGQPKADGLASDPIMAQGGGLVDVYRAVNAKALMGVAGDGIAQPGILGSHSFGAVPVINSRVTHTENVTVTVQDLTGQGGTYNLSVANNRYLEQDGITSTLSAQSVTVPAGGSATFTVNATVDGDRVRDTSKALQMQWYVVAQSAAGQTIHMPFYMRLVPTVPAGAAATQPINESGTIAAGDGGTQLVAGTTYQDFTVTTDSPAASLDVTLNFDQIVDGVAHDLDLYLYDAAGTEVTHSGNPGGPEHIAAELANPGNYTLRVVGFVAASTDFTLTGAVSKGGAAPNLQAIAGEFTDAAGKAIDFDGSYTLTWQPVGNAQLFEIEQSVNGGDYEVRGQVDGGTTRQSFTNQQDGQYSYRVRALTPGRIGYYVTSPSNTQGIVVDHRSLADISTQVRTAISNVSLTGGVFKMDMTLTNQSGNTYFPMVNLNVIRVSSTSNTVTVSNADNGGNGTSATTPALFAFSNKLGADQIFNPSETTGSRTLQFNDSASELFTFDVAVTAYTHDSGGVGAISETGAAQSTPGGGQSSSSPLSLRGVTNVMRFTVNPLTRSVTTQVLPLGR